MNQKNNKRSSLPVSLSVDRKETRQSYFNVSMKYFLSLILLITGSVYPVLAQDDLLGMLEDEVKEASNDKVFATFKGNKIINAHTTEIVKGKTWDFRIAHRFGNIINQAGSGGGGHEFFGMDNASDIRFSFDYGITDNWQIGIGRSKQFENIDLSTKYRLISQTTNDKNPVSVAWLSSLAFTPRIDPDSLYEDGLHRLSYVHQIIIARKFSSWLSMELLPTLIHQNVVREYIDIDGNELGNTTVGLGIGLRLKLNKRVALIADYFYNFSAYRRGAVDPRDPSQQYVDPFGIGVEIETGGHVFTINFTNSSGIIENSYLPFTNESWSDGAIKLGFNISRVFTVGK